MKKQKEIPWGKKVRLAEDFDIASKPLAAVLDIQPGDFIVFGKGQMKIERVEPRKSSPIISAGTVGNVMEGAYCSGIFDYKEECPV